MKAGIQYIPEYKDITDGQNIPLGQNIPDGNNETACVEVYVDENMQEHMLTGEKFNENTKDKTGNILKGIVRRLQAQNDKEICGICINLNALGVKEELKEGSITLFKEIITMARESGIAYIAFDTENVNTTNLLNQLVCDCMDDIAGYTAENGRFYIENGYVEKDKRFYHNPYSDVAALKKQITFLNEVCGMDAFGMCINIGHANLLGVNIKNFIEESAKLIGLVHVNDNNALSDQHQIPYTFTTGRGIVTTEWTHYIGSLNRIGFDGYIIFDVKGAMDKFPKELHGVVLNLCDKMVKEWKDNCFDVEKNLDQPGKTLVLFGAGRMVGSYLEAWGNKYRPAFIVDNNKEMWGQERYGIPVKPPEDILLIPEEERNVWICNTYYNAIGRQLDDMGIKYRCYYDHYFIYAQ